MIWLFFSCTEMQSTMMEWMPLRYDVPQVAEAGTTNTRVSLTKVATDLAQITDMQFLPASNSRALVTKKEGELVLIDLSNQSNTVLGSIPVRTASEQGLLSVAIAPDFTDSQRIFLHTTPKKGAARTEIAEYTLDLLDNSLRKERVLFEYEQPFPNHNGGAIRIGPDEHLYVGLGDGGWRNDPKANGQNFKTPLGGILRLSIESSEVIPSDNPFIQDSAVHDLLWSTGLRNPWKFDFLPDGRIIVADVGQNAIEEISIASAGSNLGWNVWEGDSCVESDCPAIDTRGTTFTTPIYTYTHDVGQSITGGVYLKGEHPYTGGFLFGDFVSGKIWVLSGVTTDFTAVELHQSALNISTFGQSPDGNVYVADFGSGDLYKMEFLP